MRISRGIGWVLAAVIIAGTIGSASPGHAVTVVGGTEEQRSMVDWAAGRFEAAGLELPSMEIRFHPDRDDCLDRIGYYHLEVVHLCLLRATTDSSRTVLHEMAHGWLEANVTGIERDLFLLHRGLDNWNDKRVEWGERGTEQGAEIIEWALGEQGDGTLLPSIPNNDPEQVAAAYTVLTGSPMPQPQVWGHGQTSD